MKIWKKISLVLCLCFAFSSVATSCDFLTGLNSSTENSSSTKEENNNSSSVEEENSSNIDIFLGLLASKLNKSQSAKIDFEITNDGLLETGVLESSTTWTMLSGEALVSKTEEDGFNAKINLMVTSMEEPLQPEAKEYYLIDGYVYEYYADTNTYDQYHESLDEILANFVGSATNGAYTPESLLTLLLGSGLSLDMSDLTYENLEKELEGIAVMESDVTEDNTGMWITLDASAKADELFDFLRDVNKNTTYGDILDFALKQVSPDLTSASIIKDLYPRGKDTVSELVEDLEQKSKEETDKTLQENLDTILKNEAIRELVNSVLKEENEELANDILNFNIKNFLKEDSAVQNEDGAYIKNGDLTLNDLSRELVSTLVEQLGDEGDEVLGELGLLSNNVNWGLLVGAVEMVLDWKALKDIPEDSTFYDLLEQAQALEVSKMNGKLEITLNKTGVEKIELIGNFNGNRTKDDTKMAVGGVAELLISEFSSQAVTIALPEGATLSKIIYSKCAECGEAKENVKYRETKYNYYCDDCFALLSTDEVTE